MTIPRSILLPNYLDDPAWSDLTDGIDKVFKSKIDDPTVWLSKLREKYIPGVTALDASLTRLLSESDFDMFDRETQVQTLDISGFRIPQSDNFTTQQYQRILREIGVYWYSKGTGNLADILSVVLNVPVSIETLWTNNYVNFFAEGDASIGVPLYAGGTWYPTANVQFAYDPTVTSVPLRSLLSLFYSLSNYNLVIGQIAFHLFMCVTQSGTGIKNFPNWQGTPGIAIGLYYEVEMVVPLVI